MFYFGDLVLWVLDDYFLLFKLVVELLVLVVFTDLPLQLNYSVLHLTILLTQLG